MFSAWLSVTSGRYPKGAFLWYEKGHRGCVILPIANPVSKSSGLWRALLPQMDHGAVNDGRNHRERFDSVGLLA